MLAHTLLAKVHNSAFCNTDRLCQQIKTRPILSTWIDDLTACRHVIKELLVQ